MGQGLNDTLLQRSERLEEGELTDCPLIVSDPNVMLGKPVLAGTRITVEHVMREMAAGATIDQILAQHPNLTRKQVQAAIEYGIAASAHPIGRQSDRASA